MENIQNVIMFCKSVISPVPGTNNSYQFKIEIHKFFSYLALKYLLLSAQS